MQGEVITIDELLEDINELPVVYNVEAVIQDFED